MNKATYKTIIISIICIFLSLALVGCQNKDEEIKIVRFEIEDLELVEGDTFNTSEAVITCHKSDGTIENVSENLEFDSSKLEDKLKEDNILLDDSAGEYIIPVYHLDIHIGDLKVIVKVKR